MPITRDAQQGKLRIGQGVPRGALPTTPPVAPHPVPGIPHIKPQAPLPASTFADPIATLPVHPVPTPPLPAPTPKRIPWHRISPAGYAVDLTPKGKKADLAGRGAAMLMRGNQAKQLVNRTFGRDLGPGEKHALATLHSPTDLYDRDHGESLAAIIRPGPELQSVIDSNPVLQRNQQAILGRLRDVGAGHVKGSHSEVRAVHDYLAQHNMTVDQWHAQGQGQGNTTAQEPLPVNAGETRAWNPTPEQQLGLTQGLRVNPVKSTLPETSGQGAFASAMKHGIEMEPGIPPSELPALREASLGTGVPGETQRFFSGAAKTMIGVGPGLVKHAIDTYHDPVGAQVKLGKAMLNQYEKIGQHPLRELRNDPFGTVNALYGAAAVGGGVASRVAGVKEVFDGTAQNMPKALAEARGETYTPTLTQGRGFQTARAITFGRRPGAQVYEHNGVKLVLPASKSGIGQALQKAKYEGIPKIYRGILQRLDDPHGLLNDTLSKLHKKTPDVGLSAHAAFGRGLAKQGRLDQDVNSAIATYLMGHSVGPTMPATIRNAIARMAPGDREDISALRPGKRASRMTHAEQESLDPLTQNINSMARGQNIIQNHNDLWRLGEMDPSKLPASKNLVAIKLPEYKGIQAKQFASESLAYKRFKGIAETNKDKIAKNPAAYRWVTQDMFNSMKPHNPSTEGFGNKALNVVDRGNTLIRAGRFLHPGYIGWAVQNGILHASQAGMFAFRNLYQLRNHYGLWSDEAKANAEAGVGAGIAKHTDAETPFLRRTISKLGSFWHAIDDRPFRMMSLLHEMNREGIHTAKDQETFLTHPEFADARRAIFQRSRNEAIDYAAMTPAERASMKKMFTAWGWTRGASTFTARFPFEHPVQEQLLSALGQEGNKWVDDYYAQHGGMPPAWLEAAAPVGKGRSPFLFQTGLLNPGETPGRFLHELPGATWGQTQSLMGEAAPIPAFGIEAATGINSFGNKYRGNERVVGPIRDLAKRFEPISAGMTVTKQGGSTAGGWEAAGIKYGGLPITKVKDIEKTASLGQKDFEQSLARGDLIKFKAEDHIARIPREVAAFKAKTGQTPPPAFIGKYKGAVDTVEHIQMAQQQYAEGHGAKTYKGLPAQNKVDAALNYLQATHHPTTQIQQFRDLASHLTDDKQLEGVANAIWTIAGSGAAEIVNAWKNGITKTGKPSYVTPKQ